MTLEKSVDSGYKRYDNMLNDNDLVSLRKDKKFSRFNPESDYRPNPVEEDIRLIPVGFVNNNWKCDTTTDPEIFWAKP